MIEVRLIHSFQFQSRLEKGRWSIRPASAIGYCANFATRFAKSLEENTRRLMVEALILFITFFPLLQCSLFVQSNLDFSNDSTRMAQ